MSSPSPILSPSFFSQRAMVPICIVGDSAGKGTCEEQGSVSTQAEAAPHKGKTQIPRGTKRRLSASPQQARTAPSLLLVCPQRNPILGRRDGAGQEREKLCQGSKKGTGRAVKETVPDDGSGTWGKGMRTAGMGREELQFPGTNGAAR